MTTTIRNKEVIQAWLDGKDVQYRNKGNPNWKTYRDEEDTNCMPAFRAIYMEWRIKPRANWYRNYKYNLSGLGGNCVGIVFNNELLEREVENYICFKGWLNERTEVDFSEND